MSAQKFIIFGFFTFIFMFTACSDGLSDDNMMEEDLEDEASSPPACSEDPFAIFIATPGITFEQDSSWLTYDDGSAIQGDRLGYLGWDYPGWMGSNDIVFKYPNEGLQVGEYEISSAGGVLYFDGSGGTMLLCPCVSFVLEISYLDLEQGYCCGVVSGEATNQNDELVAVEGHFKAFLDGE